MKIYRLQYTDKEAAIADLLVKEVYVETDNEEKTLLAFGLGIHSVVECGTIVLSYPTYNEADEELTPVVLAEGYYFNVMSDHDINFDVEVFPKNPKYTYAGNYEVNGTSNEVAT
jgi:hypothetical protein